MKTEDKRILLIFARYVFVFLIALFAFSLFYTIFLPLTIYPSSFLLNLFYSSNVQGNSIIAGNFKIELIEACIAGSAYYLLLLLNFSVPMPAKKRLLSFLFSFLAFLVVNILRILVFSLLYVNSFKYFDITHLVFWYVVSGIIIFLVWIATIRVFSIREVPFYTDLRYLYAKTKRSRK